MVLIATALVCGASAAAASPAPTQPTGLCDLLARVLRLECDAAPASEPAAAPASEPTADPSAKETAVRRTDPVVRYDPRRLTVTLRRGVSRPAIDALFARSHVRLELAIPQIRAYMVGVAPERRTIALRSLRDSSLVATTEREPLVDALAIIPDDDEWPQQWGLRLARFPEAWGVTRGSSGVVVAVLDTGVDRKQPELRGALVPGYDFANGDPDPTDDNGHGTSVAGIIGARANNSAGLAGICWNCSLMPVKVMDAKGVGLDSEIAAGIVWAVDHGARPRPQSQPRRTGSRGGPRQRDHVRHRQERRRGCSGREQRHDRSDLSRREPVRHQRRRDELRRSTLLLVELRRVGALLGPRLQRRADARRQRRDLLRDLIRDAPRRRPRRSRSVREPQRNAR